MHIALSNFYFAQVTRPPISPDIKSSDMEKIVTSKDDVIAFLKRVLDQSRQLALSSSPASFSAKVKVMNKGATMDGMYLLGTGTL